MVCYYHHAYQTARPRSPTHYPSSYIVSQLFKSLAVWAAAAAATAAATAASITTPAEAGYCSSLPYNSAQLTYCPATACQ